MAEFKGYRDHAKINYGTTEGKPTLEQINTGCLLRIADSVEIMSGNYLQMQSDLEYYKKRYSENGARISKLEKSNAALRGHIKSLKNKPQQ